MHRPITRARRLINSMLCYWKDYCSEATYNILFTVYFSRPQCTTSSCVGGSWIPFARLRLSEMCSIDSIFTDAFRININCVKGRMTAPLREIAIYVLPLDIAHSIWTCSAVKPSNCEHCYELNNITNHNFVVHYLHQKTILNRKLNTKSRLPSYKRVGHPACVRVGCLLSLHALL